jgi:hypothetical protein
MNRSLEEDATGPAATSPVATTDPAPIKAPDQQRGRPYDLAEWGRQVAQNAPPLSPETRDRLATLLRGVAA